MKQHRLGKMICASTLGAAQLLSVGGLHAAEAPVFDEVIVTAQKRAESVQDVPIAISALGGPALESRGYSNAEDLQMGVPGLTFGKVNVSTSQATIRGVGSENPELGGDPGVPMHIDGHYIQATAFMFRDFLDVERVEVLRGPQGTLYGRNAIGGNINIVTKRPTEEFEGQASLDIGNYEKRNAQLILSGPLTDRLRGRIAMVDEVRDGFVTNLNNRSEQYHNSDYTHVRGSLVLDATDSLEIYLQGYFFEDDGVQTIARRSDFLGPDPRKVRFDTPNPTGNDKARGLFLDVNWELDTLTFRSLSAYNKSETFARLDFDGSDVGADQPLVNGSEFKTYTQEFQLLSDSSEDLRWITGLYYYYEDSSLIIDLISEEFAFRQPADLKSESMAVFGQIDFSVTDKLELSFGARYSRDEKDMQRFQFLSFPFPGIGLPPGDYYDEEFVLTDLAVSATESWSEPSYKFSANYQLNDDVLLYASYSNGYKAGGFNGATPTEPAYDPEIVDAYEVGLKGEFFDGRVQLNSAVFFYDYTEKQEFQAVIAGFEPDGTPIVLSSISNAGAVETWGAELEILARPIDALTINLGGSWLDASYEEFSSVDDFNPNLPGVEQDLSGNQVTRAPEWKFNVGVEYEWLLGGDNGALTARVDYSWTDDYYTRPFNQAGDLIDSYDRANASLRWESYDEDMAVQFYIRNIEDDDTITNARINSPTSRSLRYLDPRTYGVKISYKF